MPNFAGLYLLEFLSARSRKQHGKEISNLDSTPISSVQKTKKTASKHGDAFVEAARNIGCDESKDR